MKSLFRQLGITSLLLCSLALTPTQASTFPDTQSHWAELGGHIDKAVALGGITGYPDGTFKPDQEVTGYELMTMIASSFFSDRVTLQINLDNSSHGIDSLNQNIDTWAIKYVYALYGHGDQGGITLFQDNNTMKSAISRFTASKIIMYALESKGIDLYPPDYSTPLGDFPEVKTVAYHGIMGGKTGGEFDGTATLTRAEATVILGNLSDLTGIYEKTVGTNTLIIPSATVGVYPDSVPEPDINTTPSPEMEVTPETDATPEVDSESDAESYLTTLREEICWLVNVERLKVGVSPLNLDTDLNTTAQVKADDMALNQEMNHTSPTLGTGTEILNKYDIQYYASAENIGFGSDLPEVIISAWMASSSHKEAILNPLFTKLGVGFSDLYWAQHFTD